MEFRPYPNHERWNDVSGEKAQDFNHHWHHVDPEQDFLSIRAADESIEAFAGFAEGWTVEIYPHPETGDMERWHFPQEGKEPAVIDAVGKVEELMEEWAEA
jgi:hypothetical protein